MAISRKEGITCNCFPACSFPSYSLKNIFSTSVFPQNIFSVFEREEEDKSITFKKHVMNRVYLYSLVFTKFIHKPTLDYLINYIRKRIAFCKRGDRKMYAEMLNNENNET